MVVQARLVIRTSVLATLRILALLLVVFPAFHFSYGTGTLIGVFRFGFRPMREAATCRPSLGPRKQDV